MHTEHYNNENNNSTHHQSDVIGAVTTLSSIAQYQADPLAVYQYFCHDKPHNLLLESAEIDQKHQLKSLLLIDAALKIECNGHHVAFTALTDNGKSALAFAKQQLTGLAKFETNTSSELLAIFAQPLTELDENSRLKAVNPFQALRLFTHLQNQNKHPFATFLGGAFAFDMMATAEKLPHVPDGDNTCPDYVYYLAETLVIIDHEKSSSEVIGNVFSGQTAATYTKAIEQRLTEIKAALASDISFNAQLSNQPSSQLASQPSNAKSNQSNNSAVSSDVSVDISDSEFCTIVDDLKEHIRAGDIFQVVPSRTFSLNCPNSLASYQALKKSNPSPYMFYMQGQDFVMFGASPESSLKYRTSDRQVEIYPIAGTRPRGFVNGKLSLDLDSRIELELRNDVKELAEHTMLVDLARNDVARVSAPGSRHVAKLLKVDRYSHVMHLVSLVVGTLSDDLDALHAYQACMNMGTLSGAPKVKATELIRQVEGKRRGSYGGAVGYFTGEGEMDSCIVIRSAFVKNGIAHVQAGAGVVYDSIPQAEANETRQKAQAVISAIQSVALTSNAAMLGAQ
jgi:anthranilate synthase component 1